MCGDCGDHLVMYTDIKSWCCTPETNIILHVNYTSILKMNLKKKKETKASTEQHKESDDAVNNIRDKGSRMRKWATWMEM